MNSGEEMKIGIVGVYGEGQDFSGGQPVKTNLIIEGMQEIYGVDNVSTVNTFELKKNKFKFLKGIFLLVRSCENILILPARNGIQILAVMLLILNVFYKRKLHYIVIGGWIGELLSNKKILIKMLDEFVGIYVETTKMKKDLNELGLNNVHVMYNYKVLERVPIEEINYNLATPYQLCTFSRVVKEKGLEDAIASVIEVNRTLGYEAFCLDIFGYIDSSYRDRFFEIIKGAPKYIRYCGTKKPTESVEVIKNYFMLVFPTRYKTEGIPGTIIDSYFAGVPVLSSRWDSFSDVIEEGVTGLGYNFKQKEDLVCKLIEIEKNPQEVIKMRLNCREIAQKYTKEHVLEKFVENIH